MPAYTTYPNSSGRHDRPFAPVQIWWGLLDFARLLLSPVFYVAEGAAYGLQRRWRRERRRRQVGRSYDMALEIARLVPAGSRTLDVGCGSGFIAQHLSALLGAKVVGTDVRKDADAPIEYLSFDGARLPLPDGTFDAVLLCYVLHHAQDQPAFLREVRRVLRAGGTAVVYEDIPGRLFDRLVCRAHDRQWRGRTGPCTFRLEDDWRGLFNASGFEVAA